MLFHHHENLVAKAFFEDSSLEFHVATGQVPQKPQRGGHHLRVVPQKLQRTGHRFHAGPIREHPLPVAPTALRVGAAAVVGPVRAVLESGCAGPTKTERTQIK